MPHFVLHFCSLGPQTTTSAPRRFVAAPGSFRDLKARSFLKDYPVRKNKPGPTVLEDFSAISATATALPKPRANDTNISPGGGRYWQVFSAKACANEPRFYGTGGFSAISAVEPALPKPRANGLGWLSCICQRPGKIAPCAQAYGKKVAKRLGFWQRRGYDAGVPKKATCQNHLLLKDTKIKSSLFPNPQIFLNIQRERRAYLYNNSLGNGIFLKRETITSCWKLIFASEN